MSEFSPSIHQSAAGDADIELMAGVVHTVNFYRATPASTPEQLLEEGRKYLTIDATDKARELIDRAIRQGLRGGDACLYPVLSLLSGRTLDQLTEQETSRLNNARTAVLNPGTPCPADEAAHVALDLVSLETSVSGDAEAAFDRLGRLPDEWRVPIQQHLKLVLKGKNKNEPWRRLVAQARRDQLKGGRLQRAWKFFEPVPAPPRRAVVRRPSVDPRSLLQLVLSCVATLVLLLILVDVAWDHFPIKTFFLGPIVVLCAAGWAYVSTDQRAERQVRSQPALNQLPLVGIPTNPFTSPLRYYCTKYTSGWPHQKAWLEQTADIREAVAQELAATYPQMASREIAGLRWLIRHRAAQICRGATGATQHAISSENQYPAWLRSVGLEVGPVAGPLAALVLLLSLFASSPLTAILLVPVIIVSASFAVPTGLDLLAAKRYHHYANRRADAEFQCAEKAFARWQQRISNMPTELEMAQWLDADRTLIIDEALKHYRLEPLNIQSHATLETPGRKNRTGRNRARVPQGPWRHRTYKIITFLLTGEGVRQITTHLDFVQAIHSDEAQKSYRYDAIGSVEVSRRPRGDGRVLRLRMMDGESNEFAVAGSEPTDDAVDSSDEAAAISADAAGLNETLHLLEGVAAEGKRWMGRSREPETLSSRETDAPGRHQHDHAVR